MRKLLAFTLAEVMLAMTIVGVVAAMTIPTLRYERTKKEYSAKLKNFYSRMDNALLDMEMEHGSFRDMIKPAASAQAHYEWYMRYVDSFMGHEYVNEDAHRVYFKDGSSLQLMQPGGCGDMVYDINGDKGPNRPGFDRYYFLYCFDDTARNSYFGNSDIFFGSYGGGLSAVGTSREALIQKCKDSPPYCSKLLQNDQWEFKGDYPFKF